MAVANKPARFRTVAGQLAGFWGALAVGLFLFLLDAVFLSQPSAYGISDPVATKRLLDHYGAFFAWEQVRILGRVLLSFACMGLLAQWVANRWCLFWNRTHQAGWQRFGLGILCTLWLHTWLTLKAMLLYPHIHADPWYQRGLRWFVHAWTYAMNPFWVDSFFLGILTVIAVAPLLRTSVRRATWGTTLQKSLYAVLLVGASGVAFAAWRSNLPPEGPVPTSAVQQRPSILLITVESLRTDRIRPDTMPHLYRLAQQSVFFPKTVVGLPRTLSSWTTLLTGQYPPHHGIRTMFPSREECDHIPPALPTMLPGYQTAMWSDTTGDFFHRLPYGFAYQHNPVFKGKDALEGIARDLHVFVGPYATTPFPSHLRNVLTAPQPFAFGDALYRWMRAQPQKPFLYGVFLGTPHVPYATPWPYFKRFPDPAYAGTFLFQRGPTGSWSPPPEERQQANALYNNAAFFTDAQIERLLKQLSQAGLLEHTIVVITSDHGEVLYDRDGIHMGHGEHLSGPHMIQVPLLVFDPIHRFPAHQVDSVVRMVDVVPTLLELVGQPAQPTDGVSLLPLLWGNTPSLHLSAYVETGLWYGDSHPEATPGERLYYPSLGRLIEPDENDDFRIPAAWSDTVVCAKHRGLVTDRWKWIFKPTPHGIMWYLYDLQNDPGEKHNLAMTAPPDALLLQQTLLQMIRDDAVWPRCEAKFPFLQLPKAPSPTTTLSRQERNPQTTR